MRWEGSACGIRANAVRLRARSNGHGIPRPARLDTLFLVRGNFITVIRADLSRRRTVNPLPIINKAGGWAWSSILR